MVLGLLCAGSLFYGCLGSLGFVFGCFSVEFCYGAYFVLVGLIPCWVFIVLGDTVCVVCVIVVNSVGCSSYFVFVGYYCSW